jgi:hypothetical protein
LEICSTETIDRLLRVTDQEEFAWLKFHLRPLGRARFLLGEKAHDLGLEGVCVLKFINEEKTKSLLKVSPDMRLALEKVAGEKQQVNKIEATLLTLLLLVSGKITMQPERQRNGKVMRPRRAWLSASAPKSRRASSSAFVGRQFVFVPAFPETGKSVTSNRSQAERSCPSFIASKSSSKVAICV